MNNTKNSFMSEAAEAVANSHPMTIKDALDILRFMLGITLTLGMLVALI